MSTRLPSPEDLPIGPFTRIVSAATVSAAFALPTGSSAPAPRKKDHKGAIIGGVIGGVAGLLLLLALVWFLVRWRRSRTRTKRTRQGHEELGDIDSTAAPTPQQKHSEDRPQVAQVRGAVQGVSLPGPGTSGASSAPGAPGVPAPPPAPTMTTTPATLRRGEDTLSPLPSSPPGSPPGSSLGHGSLAVPPSALTGRPDSPLSFASLRHARSPSLSSVLSDYVDASEIAATPISASESPAADRLLSSALVCTSRDLVNLRRSK